MIREALSYIASTDRDTWVRMAMAVKDELGEGGFEVWDAWSQNADNYNEQSARSVWRSISVGGGVTAATLYAEARRAGWRGSGRPDPNPNPKRKSYRDAQKRSDEQAQRQTAERAQRMLDRALLSPHDYLARKGFPSQLGLVLNGMLLVPMRDIRTGELRSLQTVTTDGEKRFLKGGKASGSSYALGSGLETYLCEGFATALSVKAALNVLYRRALVVATFSAANIVKVAAQLNRRNVYVVADNDESGTGQKYAERTGLPWWMPPDIGDANDYHQTQGIRALAAALNSLRSSKRWSEYA